MVPLQNHRTAEPQNRRTADPYISMEFVDLRFCEGTIKVQILYIAYTHQSNWVNFICCSIYSDCTFMVPSQTRRTAELQTHIYQWNLWRLCKSVVTLCRIADKIDPVGLVYVCFI